MPSLDMTFVYVRKRICSRPVASMRRACWIAGEIVHKLAISEKPTAGTGCDIMGLYEFILIMTGGDVMNAKKWLALLMILALALGMWPGALAEATAAGELPKVGDVVHGFEVVELRDYRLLDATIVRFIHRQTGAEL